MSPKKITKADVNARLSCRGIVLLGENINSDTMALFRCNKGHTWKAKPTNVLHGNTGCPFCSRRKVSLTRTIVNERLSNRGITMLDEYVHQTVKARFQCNEGHIWEARPNNVLSGKGCPECARAKKGSYRKLSSEIVNERLEGRGITLNGEYVNSQTKALFKCDKGHSWKAVPNSVMAGKGCPECAGNAPLTKEIINERISDRGITLIGEYSGAHVNTDFQCQEGHIWSARPGNILQGKNCPHCDGQFPLSKEIVNERVADRGIVMLGEYVSTQTAAQFKCKEGHIWETLPNSVLSGTSCPFCAGNLPLTKEIVNERIAHRGIVLLDEYTNNTTKCRFQCSEGHIWETAPANVLSGRGCHICSDHTSDNDAFYIWKAGPQELVKLRNDEHLVKYGLTSESRQELRIKEVAWMWKTIPTILALVKTEESAVWAERAASGIGKRLSYDYSNLDGWSEFRIVTESEIAQLMGIANDVAEHKIIWNGSTDPDQYPHFGQLKLPFPELQPKSF